jgi:hypothetical protein
MPIMIRKMCSGQIVRVPYSGRSDQEECSRPAVSR